MRTQDGCSEGNIAKKDRKEGKGCYTVVFHGDAHAMGAAVHLWANGASRAHTILAAKRGEKGKRKSAAMRQLATCRFPN